MLHNGNDIFDIYSVDFSYSNFIQGHTQNCSKYDLNFIKKKNSIEVKHYGVNFVVLVLSKKINARLNQFQK